MAAHTATCRYCERDFAYQSVPGTSFEYLPCPHCNMKQVVDVPSATNDSAK